MSKKDFSNLNGGFVANAISTATAAEGTRKPRKTYTEEQSAEYLASMKTTGHKGVKLPRYNVAFAPAIYEYIATMSRVSGMNITEFVNDVLRQHLESHKDIYKKAQEFRKSL